MDFTAQKQRIDRAKLSILTDRNMVFYSEVLCRLRITVSEEVATAGTNGTCIMFNPKFVDKQEHNELVGLLLHELMHVVYLDMSRCKEMDLNPRKWNGACDYAINGELVYTFGYTIPKNGLIDRKWLGKSRKQIYDEMRDDDGTDGDTSDLLSEVSDKELEEIKSMVIQSAIAVQKQHGTAHIPEMIRQQLDSWLNPKLPYKQLLSNYMKARVGTDRDFTKPNRRYWTKYFIPRNTSKGMEHIAIGIDVSGSITNAELNEVLAEVKSLVSDMPTNETDVYQWDTRIRDVQTYRSPSEFPEEIALKGGGGTQIACLFDAVVKNPPELLIVFTDLDFSTPSFVEVAAAGIDILWLVKGTTPFTLEYGDCIRYE